MANFTARAPIVCKLVIYGVMKNKDPQPPLMDTDNQLYDSAYIT